MLSRKGPITLIESKSCLCKGHPKNHTICLRVLAKHFLNSVHFAVVTTSLGSLCQCPTILFVKTSPISNINLLQLSFMPFSQVLVTIYKRGEISVCPSTSPCEVVEDHKEDSPQSPPGWIDQELSATSLLASLSEPSPSLWPHFGC